MAERWLRGEVAGGVGTITIDRPDKRNAMTTAMWHHLPELLEMFAADPAVRVVVLTGAGGNFCAGADIGELTGIGRRGDAHPSTFAEEALAAFPKPTIAAIEGFCVGGGCQLATACDLRFASADARFGVTPARLGIVYPASATQRLVRQVGASAAKYLIYSADLIPAEHALRIGLLNEVVEDVHKRVEAFAATLASRSLLTQRATKEIVDTIATGADPGAVTGRWLAEAHAPNGDMEEGVAAFQERRPPHFTWNAPSL
ncbi:enoyl-CoA hydratase/isomerase family protein [Actinomadura vinacea]|uniref:Enoyl-CoA hydratase/isomerase family protein n=1 Tax=Actinomadura vinacea TaxID=115336 RepID=A0ABP5X0Z1_9ACTN